MKKNLIISGILLIITIINVLNPNIAFFLFGGISGMVVISCLNDKINVAIKETLLIVGLYCITNFTVCINSELSIYCHTWMRGVAIPIINIVIISIMMVISCFIVFLGVSLKKYYLNKKQNSIDI